jgi:hypothetical protein
LRGHALFPYPPVVGGCAAGRMVRRPVAKPAGGVALSRAFWAARVASHRGFGWQPHRCTAKLWPEGAL